MPSYYNITLTLQSQYDAAVIQENHTRTFTPTPTLHSLNLNGESPGLMQHPDKTFEELQMRSAGTTVVEVEIPVFERSQFWVCYECRLPGTIREAGGEPREEEDVSEEEGVREQRRKEEVKYYYFKLFVSGRCITSWGVGQRDGWKGKMVFGLFDGGRDFEGRRIVEKRGLFFPGLTANGDGDGFEIKVYRAKARRRETAKYQGLGEVLGGCDGSVCPLDLTSIGKAHKGERQRFYSYALIDAKDEPWVVFRYKFEMEDDTARIESTLLSTDPEDTTTSFIADTQRTEDGAADPNDSSLWSGLEQNTPPQASDTGRTRRLSFPPRNLLYPSTRNFEPSSPVKHPSASDDSLVRPPSESQQRQYYSIAFREHATPATGLRKPEWTVPPPAQAKSSKDAEQSHKKSGSGSGGLLRSVVASARRRRG